MKSAKPGAYWAAQIVNDKPGYKVTVYFRKEAAGWKLVGIDRDTPRTAGVRT